MVFLFHTLSHLLAWVVSIRCVRHPDAIIVVSSHSGGYVIARMHRCANKMLGHKSFNLKLTQLNEFLIANKKKSQPRFASGANKQNVFRCLPQFAQRMGSASEEKPFPQFQLYKHGIDAVEKEKPLTSV